MFDFLQNFSSPCFAFRILFPLWLLVMVKRLFFSLWLWQLKEYHFWRLLAHFETAKGKRAVFNWFNGLALAIILGLLFLPQLSPGLATAFILLLFLELALGLYQVFKGSFRKPVFTFKTAFLLIMGFCLIICVGCFLGFSVLSVRNLFLGFLLNYLFSFFLFSLPVGLSQPFFILLRSRLLAKAKKKIAARKDLIVIGITGSYGKSSTKEFLATILSEKFRVLKTQKNQNSEVGISQCILKELKPEHEIFVCEMGAYLKGGIKQLCQIARPQIGILTGINEQHLATFGSQEKIIQAKFELLESLSENGIAFLNADNPLIDAAMSGTGEWQPQIKAGKQKLLSAREQIKDLQIEKDFLSFTLAGVEFNLNLVGRQNIENLLLAICCAQELEMSLGEIKFACEKIKPFRKTMELKRSKEGVMIIDDTYSANPQGVLAALAYLSGYSGKKIIIMPCLIELGSVSKKIHQEIGRAIGQVCDLAIITTKDRFKEIKQGAIESGMKEESVLFLEKPIGIYKKIESYLAPENVILLESRVPETLIRQLATSH